MNRLEQSVRRVDRVQQSRRPLAIAFGVMKKFGDDNGGTLVANLAFAAVIALFPLLLILVTVLSLVFAGHPAVRDQILHSAFGQFPLIGRQLGGNIHALRRSSIVGLAIGLAGLLWGSIGFAQAGLFAMAQVWNLPGPDRPNYPRRLARGLAFLATLGVSMVVSAFLAAFGTYGSHPLWLGLLSELLAVAVNVGQFLVGFRILTPRAVATRQLVAGAVVGGIGWTLLLALGGYLIGHDLRNDGALYGTFASLLGLLAWVYLAAELSVYAAEVNPVLARRLWPRSLVQPPLTEADERALSLEATQNRRRPEQVVAVTFGRSAGPAGQDDLEGASAAGITRHRVDPPGARGASP